MLVWLQGVSNIWSQSNDLPFSLVMIYTRHTSIKNASQKTRFKKKNCRVAALRGDSTLHNILRVIKVGGKLARKLV